MKVTSKKIVSRSGKQTEHTPCAPYGDASKDIGMASWLTDGSRFDLVFGIDGRRYMLELTREEMKDLSSAFRNALKETS